MFSVLLNVGSSSRNRNGRGRINKNKTFQYLPVPEVYSTREKVPTYHDMGFDNVKHPEYPVHLDPEFKTYTYGHIERGFGDMKNLLRLGRNDILFFFATLQNEQKWAPYIIGYFKGVRVYDCGQMSNAEIRKLKRIGFKNNAHLKRTEPRVHLLIKGGKGSKLLKKAFPLANMDKPKTLRRSLKGLIRTPTGKEIPSGTQWCRWTLTCNKPRELLQKLEN